MSKCEIIKADYIFKLEDEINNFIKNKQVIDISMCIRPFDGINTTDSYYACIIYED